MKNIYALLLGGLFSCGLMFSGMANPEKVLNFLDITGTWDPSLAFVMLGAILLAFIPFQKALGQTKTHTILNEKIDLPTATQIDAKLIVGSLLFGVGWGIAGMCPAPSLSLLALGHHQSIYFIIAMLLGVYLHKKYTGA